jgi:hypothetical protein
MTVVFLLCHDASNNFSIVVSPVKMEMMEMEV